MADISTFTSRIALSPFRQYTLEQVQSCPKLHSTLHGEMFSNPTITRYSTPQCLRRKVRVNLARDGILDCTRPVIRIGGG